jgi:hypothetical protein
LPALPNGKAERECILGLVAYYLKHHNASQWIKKTWVKNKAAMANGYATSMFATRYGVKDECIAAVAIFAN